MKLILILLLSINVTFALDVTPIKQGEQAPKDGFFVDAENMKELRRINEERKLLTKENVTLKDLGTINEERIKTYKKYAETTSNQLGWEKTKGNFKGTAGFILGVLATSIAAYAAIKVTK